MSLIYSELNEPHVLHLHRETEISSQPKKEVKKDPGFNMSQEEYDVAIAKLRLLFAEKQMAKRETIKKIVSKPERNPIKRCQADKVKLPVVKSPVKMIQPSVQTINVISAIRYSSFKSVIIFQFDSKTFRLDFNEELSSGLIFDTDGIVNNEKLLVELTSMIHNNQINFINV